MKLTDCSYDKIKLLHKLSCIVWFIEKHAQEDAQQEGDKKFHRLLKDLRKTLEPYIQEIHLLVCTHDAQEKNSKKENNGTKKKNGRNK